MSKSYIIIADSCMDLSAEQRKEFDVEFPIEGTIIYPDGHGEKADVDWQRQTFDDYFNRLNNKKLVFKTALPNQFEIESRLKEYLEKGLDILAVTLSGGMSGTYNCFMAAKNSLEKQFPDRHVLVVDSRRYSAGISLLCVYASINRDKGMSLEENFQWLEEHKLCGHQIGILDNLFSYIVQGAFLT